MGWRTNGWKDGTDWQTGNVPTGQRLQILESLLVTSANEQPARTTDCTQHRPQPQLPRRHLSRPLLLGQRLGLWFRALLGGGSLLVLLLLVSSLPLVSAVFVLPG